jgi:hypothetical protein
VKKKSLIISFFLFKTFVALSQDEIGQSAVESSPRPRPKPNLMQVDKSPRPLPRSLGDPRPLTPEEIKELQAKPCPGGEFCPGFSSLRDSYSTLCDRFITPSGLVNGDDIGITMYEAMAEVEKAHTPEGASAPTCSFKNNFNFGKACPYFIHMTPLQKDHVWMWLWASIAQAESSCDPTKEARGIIDEETGRQKIADGLFGLEKHFEDRKIRDPRFCPHEEVADSKNLFFQSRCAASIMYDLNCNKSTIIDSNSYWEQIHYFTRKIPQLMQKHPLCNIKP